MWTVRQRQTKSNCGENGETPIKTVGGQTG